MCMQSKRRRKKRETLEKKNIENMKIHEKNMKRINKNFNTSFFFMN